MPQDKLTLTVFGDATSVSPVANPYGNLNGGNNSLYTFDVLYGDVTGDGTVNQVDFLSMRRAALVYSAFADLDRNGQISAFDFLVVRSYLP
jgi:hypothetical protein